MQNRSRFLLVAALLLGAPPIFALTAFAQQPTSVTTHIDQIWTDGGNVRFKVSFLTASGTVQPHIDYNVVVTSKSGTEIFNAAKKVNTPVLHTAEGVVTIPQEPDSPITLDNGDYQVNATVYGILFNPVTPSSYVLPVTSIPEFPSQFIIATAGLVAVAIVISRIIISGPGPRLR